MPRLITAGAAALALATLSGCSVYDVTATNSSSQDVRISLVKGSRQIRISDVVLEPGGSVHWAGKTNGKVRARVGHVPAGAVTVVEIPRKIHTTLEVAGTGGTLHIVSNIPQEPADEPAAEPDPAPTAAPAEPAPEPDSPDQADAPPVDLIEDDG